MSGSLPAATGIGRVALTVGDVGEAVEFYRDVVGLHVRSRAGETATLGTPETALLELRTDPDAPRRPDDAAGLYHTAVRVPARPALGDALERVRDRWRLDGASDHLVSEALYLRDPEGNGVEIYCDRPRSEWPTTEDGSVQMATDPLDLADLSARAAGEDAVPAGADVGHVHLEVTSLASARAFYADALGMNVRQRLPGALFLAAGDYHHHVGCNVWADRSAPATGRGLDWVEVTVPDEATLTAARERLADAGADLLARPENPDAGAGVAVADPDGIDLRLRVADGG